MQRRPTLPLPSQAAVLRLLSCRRAEPLHSRLLKHLLLLRQPPAPPVRALRVLPSHYTRLCSTCALTFAAFCLWGARAMLALPPRPASLAR